MKKLLIFVGGLIAGFFAGIAYKEHSQDKIVEVIPVDPPKESVRTSGTVPQKPKLDQLVAKYRTEEKDYVQYSDGQSSDSGIHDRSVEATPEDESPRESVLYPTDDDPDEEENDEDDGDPEELQDPKFSKPWIMTLQEFENENKHYDTETLHYYTFDDTVCTDEDVVIPAPDDMIGEDALVCFGMGSQDPNIVYICNDRTSTKYEVVKVDAAYSELILGMKYEPKNGNKFVRREDSDLD